MKGKQIKIIIRVLFLFFAAVLFCSTGVHAAAVLKIEEESQTDTYYIRKKYQFKVKVPKEDEGRKLRWSSSNPTVGMISQKGVFKARKAGTTIIKVQIAGTKQWGSLQIEVKKFIKPKSIRIENISKTMGVGSVRKLETVVAPQNAVYQKIEWVSDNPKVAKVSGKGKVKALSTGKARITAYVKGTKLKASFKLKVIEAVPLKSIKIEAASKTMDTGDTLVLKVKRKPLKTTFTDLKWRSSKEEVAVVSKDGVVHALKAGKTKITVKAPGTKLKASIKITVKEKKIAATGIKFIGNNAKTVEYGNKTQLRAQVLPLNATNKNIIWATSDKTKATVDQNGVVTALRPTESVTITARTADRKYLASYEMQITANQGFLVKADLDKLNLASVKKVMIVAHPDDELLWGGSHLLDEEYLVVVLTHGWNTIRKSDFSRVMNYMNRKSIILSYPDSKREYWKGNVWSYDTDSLSTCLNGIRKDLQLILTYKNWDEVATHNPQGEYGKYHHQMTNKLVTEGFNKYLRGKSKLYYFGRFYSASAQIPGERISEENLAVKNKLVEYYLPTAKGAIVAFGHMLPYENWISAEQWKQSNRNRTM